MFQAEEQPCAWCAGEQRASIAGLERGRKRSAEMGGG